jgi:hypothetical protein
VLHTLPAFIGGGAMRAVGAVAGKVIVRKGRALVKLDASSLTGMLTEAGIAIALGVGVSMFHEGAGEQLLAGGLQAPLETGIHKARIPIAADALADDDAYRIGLNDDQLAVLSGYMPGQIPLFPARAAGLADEVGDDTRFLATA